MRVVRSGSTPEEFYIIPGGTWENGELLEDTCIREIQEECSITIGINDLAFVVVGDKRIAFYFSCQYHGGDIQLGGPEKVVHDSNEPEEIFVEWLPLRDVRQLPIGPVETREALIAYLEKQALI